MERLSERRFDREATYDLLEGGVPLVGRCAEIVGPHVIKVELLVDAFGTPAGTRVHVGQAPHIKGKRSLSAAIAGSDDVAKLRPGDVVAFPRTFLADGAAWTGEVAARTHDLHQGPVQVFTAMAKPTFPRVTSKGASQYLTITDGSAAKVAKTIEQVEAFFHQITPRPWLGKGQGFLLRRRDQRVRNFFLIGDTRLSHILDDIRESAVLEDDGIVELIPAWMMPMGRSQVTRDVNPKQEKTDKSPGPFSSDFATGKQNRLGYCACLVITGQEEEWAFGGKTGRIRDVALGVQPVNCKPPVDERVLPTRARKLGGNVNGIRTLYTDEEMAADAKRRAGLTSRPTEPKPQQSGSGLGLKTARAIPVPGMRR